ncbi:MAG: SIMPL domain-containing protein [Alphaproteobacteria bacterium]|nr:SIMPL domain-containing protein [Alphaproteobacteria bacterium]
MTDTTSPCFKSGFWPIALGLAALAVGVGLGGNMILTGLKEFRSFDRYVTVKGLSTRDVVADQAVWVLNFTVTGTQLTDAQAAIEQNEKDVRAYLVSQGLKEDQIMLQNFTVSDNQAKTYGETDQAGPRYVLTQALLARSNDVEAVLRASQNIAELVKKNVTLGTPNGGWNPAPQYTFTKINDIKPDMIAEATKNARISAVQFANDSGQAVGQIRSANQGVLQIEPRDPGVSESETPYKSVRVVSTVEYYLGE